MRDTAHRLLTVALLGYQQTWGRDLHRRCTTGPPSVPTATEGGRVRAPPNGRRLLTNHYALLKGHALFSLVFGRHLMYLLLVGLASAAVYAVVALLLRRRTDRPWDYAAWAAFTTAALFLTLWIRPGGSSGMCVVNKDVWEPMGTAQGRMNFALFVPIGLFGLRAARRPVPPLLLSVVLSSGIESVQAAVPAIGRYCDTSDLLTNVAGAVVGVGVGVLSVRFSRRRLPPWGVRRRSMSAVAGAGFSAVACIVATTAGVRVVDHAEGTRTASAEQWAAVGTVVRQALGSGFRVKHTSDVTPYGLDGVDQSVWAELEPAGMVHMAWPDRDSIDIDVQVHQSFGHPPTGYPVPGAAGPVHDPAAARRVADRYVASHYPAAVTAGARADRPEDQPEETWTVTYAYRDDRMPALASLRVTLNGAGRLRGVRLSATAPVARPALPADCPQKQLKAGTCGR
ncbi:VanZ family protein [Streptomyces sp. NBC_00316]|uniref:VanZ family protein n=1 Tax=Streptomyces sp. NBC_00316 TaxID=2975710 RepID=UPI002E2D6E82|nr:VanZ family protein [Streptomyces sp. NBC_00316]